MLAVVAVALLAINLLAAQVACNTGDVATCAYSATKDGFYTGRFLATGAGRVVNAYFGSLQQERAVPLAVGADGGFCLVWAHERVAEASPARHDPHRLVRGVDGTVVLRDWRPAGSRGAPSACQRSSATIPWHRATDLSSSWEYLLLFSVPVAALILAVGTRLLTPRLGTAALLSSVLALSVSAALSLTLW